MIEEAEVPPLSTLGMYQVVAPVGEMDTAKSRAVP
jgi:hypothetical protein